MYREPQTTSYPSRISAMIGARVASPLVPSPSIVMMTSSGAEISVAYRRPVSKAAATPRLVPCERISRWSVLFISRTMASVRSVLPSSTTMTSRSSSLRSRRARSVSPIPASSLYASITSRVFTSSNSDVVTT